MAEKTISVEFDGYWRDENKGELPAKSGVYCVYECIHNVKGKNITIHKLIYIGESENVTNRVANHEKYGDWLKHVKKENELCFSFGVVVGSTGRDPYKDRAEAAMIFKHKPSENKEYKKLFPFDKTTMSLSGETAKLTSDFTVDRS